MINYKQSIEYLYQRLPMFSRIGAKALKNNLDNITLLCAALQNPEQKFKSIHIAGTNGKGSTSHLICAILQSAGYKTGLYTSPHLRDFRERIRINGKPITKSIVSSFVNKHQKLFEQINPSFFEMTVALAFDTFAKEQVDVAIVEVGLGGRLDATNIIHPDLSIITNIDFDHTDLLGNTLPEIAREKAGIVKPNTPLVVGEYHPETFPVFKKVSKENNVDLHLASDYWSVKISTQDRYLHLDASKKDAPPLKILSELKGGYQAKNIGTVLCAIDELRRLGYAISDDNVLKGCQEVCNITGLMGRWQTLRKRPLCICDTGHNVSGIREVTQQIKQIPYQTLHFVLGMVKDKDISSVLSLLPKDALYYFCNAKIERAMPANELQSLAIEFGLQGRSFASVQEAYQSAIDHASNKDLVFVGGSTFTVAEVV